MRHDHGQPGAGGQRVRVHGGRPDTYVPVTVLANEPTKLRFWDPLGQDQASPKTPSWGALQGTGLNPRGYRGLENLPTTSPERSIKKIAHLSQPGLSLEPGFEPFCLAGWGGSIESVGRGQHCSRGDPEPVLLPVLQGTGELGEESPVQGFLVPWFKKVA